MTNSYKIIEINELVWELSKCSCQYWKKHYIYICKHLIGISYELSKLDNFPALDLSIEHNAKRGRRKKASYALERNSAGPLNPELFKRPTASAQAIAGTANSETNDSQPALNNLTNQAKPSKRPRGRPKKVRN